MIELKNYVAGETLLLPTKYSEIDLDYIQNCVSEVNLANDHCVIAIIYKEKLSLVLGASKSNQQRSSQVFTILAKEDNEGKLKLATDANIMDKVVITGSDISRGYHLYFKYNRLSIDKVVKFINEDKDLYKEVSLNGVIGKQLAADNSYCYFVEFKEVPICDIKGTYKNNTKICKLISKLEGTRSTLIL